MQSAYHLRNEPDFWSLSTTSPMNQYTANNCIFAEPLVKNEWCGFWFSFTGRRFPGRLKDVT